jgi:hypothetical protein
MPRQVYRKKTNQKNIIKVRLQHTAPDGDLSPILETLAAHIDRTQLYSFSGPRLGTNPKYAENQATAIYLEVDAQTLQRMFEYLTFALDLERGI